MEMRVESYYETNKTKQFNEFREFVNNTRDGVALCTENSEDEILFRKDNIDNLFIIINIKTIINVEYIADNCNIFIKKQKAIVRLSDGRQVIVEKL